MNKALANARAPEKTRRSGGAREQGRGEPVRRRRRDRRSACPIQDRVNRRAEKAQPLLEFGQGFRQPGRPVVGGGRNGGDQIPIPPAG